MLFWLMKKNNKINKNNKEHSLSIKQILLSPISRQGSDRKVFRHPSLKGSLTLESAWVLPIFLFTVLSLLSFLRIYQLQTEHMTKLCDQAKKAGVYAFFYQEEEREIIRSDMVSFRPIVSLFPIQTIRFFYTVKVYPWIGSEAAVSSEEGEEMVYVTEHGEVYHATNSCSYLNVSVQQVTSSRITEYRNKNGGKYYPCEICGQKRSAGIFYITSWGDRYHSSASCSKLHRSIRLIRRSEAVQEYRPCSRCG